jgi:hypothetical protein
MPGHAQRWPGPVWHARGQGFESPKLHVSAAQRHISILKMIFDFLHCTSCRWPLASGSGTGVLARQGTPADPGRQPVPLEGRSPGAKVGANGDRLILPRARERVAVARQSRQPAATRRLLHGGYLRVDTRLPNRARKRLMTSSRHWAHLSSSSVPRRLRHIRCVRWVGGLFRQHRNQGSNGAGL